MRGPAHKAWVGLVVLLLSAPPAAAGPARGRAKPKRTRPPAAQPAPTSPRGEAEDPPSVGGASGSPPFLWRQVFAAPSIGDRVRTFTIDPRDARRIFVGTEEGRILRSTDGGVTWLEIDPQPFLIKDRSLSVVAPSRPDVDDAPESNFQGGASPPESFNAARLRPLRVDDPFPVSPDFFWAGLYFDSPSAPQSLLGGVTRSRASEVVPIRHIAVCPGARYEVFVATRLELLGSMDGGLSYVRLFANPGGLEVERVSCTPQRPSHVALTTEAGLFVSRNGGVTFDQDLTAWPGQPASVSEFGPTDADGRLTLYSASDSELYAGDPDDPKGLEYIYPSDDNTTAPWRTIRGLSVDGRDIWLGTDDGVRRSRDGGKSWETVARMLFSQQTAEQVVVGESEAGGRRVAVMINHTPRDSGGSPVSGLHDSIVYSSDDGGETWLPFFFGLSRRSFRIMAFVPAQGDRPASWWIATSGEIWTTAPFVRAVEPSTPAEVEWAAAALARTPPLAEVIARALETQALSNEAIHRFAERRRRAAWVPRLDLLFRHRDPLRETAEQVAAPLDPSLTYAEATSARDRGLELLALLSWDLFDTQTVVDEVSSTRTRLHDLRKQIAYAVEDAWHERIVNLELVAQGLSDPVQALTLKSRIEALDALLAVWTGQERWETR